MPRPYQRVAADLRDRITSGEWPPGHRIPSWRNLAAEHDVGQGTIRLAIAELRAAGLVEGHPRARLTVAYRPTVHTLDDPDAPWPHGRGDVERSTVRADDDLARRLAVPARTRLLRERVELLDRNERPAMLVTSWRRTAAEQPHAGHRCVMYVGTLRRDDAGLLGLAAGIAVIVLERTRNDADGRPVETADLVLPADRWRVAF